MLFFVSILIQGLLFEGYCTAQRRIVRATIRIDFQHSCLKFQASVGENEDDKETTDFDNCLRTVHTVDEVIAILLGHNIGSISTTCESSPVKPPSIHAFFQSPAKAPHRVSSFAALARDGVALVQACNCSQLRDGAIMIQAAAVDSEGAAECIGRCALEALVTAAAVVLPTNIMGTTEQLSLLTLTIGSILDTAPQNLKAPSRTVNAIALVMRGNNANPLLFWKVVAALLQRPDVRMAAIQQEFSRDIADAYRRKSPLLIPLSNKLLVGVRKSPCKSSVESSDLPSPSMQLNDTPMSEPPATFTPRLAGTRLSIPRLSLPSPTESTNGTPTSGLTRATRREFGAIHSIPEWNSRVTDLAPSNFPSFWDSPRPRSNSMRDCTASEKMASISEALGESLMAMDLTSIVSFKRQLYLTRTLEDGANIDGPAKYIEYPTVSSRKQVLKAHRIITSNYSFDEESSLSISEESNDGEGKDTADASNTACESFHTDIDVAEIKNLMIQVMDASLSFDPKNPPAVIQPGCNVASLISVEVLSINIANVSSSDLALRDACMRVLARLAARQEHILFDASSRAKGPHVFLVCVGAKLDQALIGTGRITSTLSSQLCNWLSLASEYLSNVDSAKSALSFGLHCFPGCVKALNSLQILGILPCKWNQHYWHLFHCLISACTPFIKNCREVEMERDIVKTFLGNIKTARMLAMVSELSLLLETKPATRGGEVAVQTSFQRDLLGFFTAFIDLLSRIPAVNAPCELSSNSGSDIVVLLEPGSIRPSRQHMTRRHALNFFAPLIAPGNFLVKQIHDNGQTSDEALKNSISSCSLSPPSFAAVRLRPAVFKFLRSAYMALDSPFIADKNIADYYIRFHFIQFLKLYHNPNRDHQSSFLCREHLAALQALADASKIDTVPHVRQRFQQLAVLDFFVREVSLEFEATQFSKRASTNSNSAKSYIIQSNANTSGDEGRTPVHSSQREAPASSLERNIASHIRSKSSSYVESKKMGVSFSCCDNEDDLGFIVAEGSEEKNPDEKDHHDLKSGNGITGPQGTCVPKLNLALGGHSSSFHLRHNLSEFSTPKTAVPLLNDMYSAFNPSSKVSSGMIELTQGKPKAQYFLSEMKDKKTGGKSPEIIDQERNINHRHYKSSSSGSLPQDFVFSGDLDEDVELLEKLEESAAISRPITDKIRMNHEDCDYCSTKSSSYSDSTITEDSEDASDHSIKKLSGNIRDGSTQLMPTKASDNKPKIVVPELSIGGVLSKISENDIILPDSPPPRLSGPAVPLLNITSSMHSSFEARSSSTELAVAAEAEQARRKAGRSFFGELEASALGKGKMQAATAPHNRNPSDILLNSFKARFRYSEERSRRPLYTDEQLHVSALVLIMSLLLSPTGQLDTSYCDPYPWDRKLQNIPFILHHHLNHPANRDVLPSLLSSVNKMGMAAIRLLRSLCTYFFRPSWYSRRLRISGVTGAYATVYRCILPRWARGRTAVLKSLDMPEHVQDRCVQVDFHSEVTILESLSGHSSACQMYDYGLDLNSRALTLVLKDYKCSLKQWRNAQPENAWPKLGLYYKIFREIVIAVNKLLLAGVVHFDLKCDNILLEQLPETSTNEFWSATSSKLPFRVILADFGESKMFGASSDVGHCSSDTRNGRTSRLKSSSFRSDSPGCVNSHISSLTGESAACEGAVTSRARGTDAFKSPEMLLVGGAPQKQDRRFDRRRQRGAGAASDVWSLGCLFFELVTGKLLFSDTDWLQLVGRVTSPGMQIITQDRIEMVKELPGVLDLLQYILVRDPSLRPTITDTLRQVDATIAVYGSMMLKPTEYTPVTEKEEAHEVDPVHEGSTFNAFEGVDLQPLALISAARIESDLYFSAVDIPDVAGLLQENGVEHVVLIIGNCGEKKESWQGNDIKSQSFTELMIQNILCRNKYIEWLECCARIGADWKIFSGDQVGQKDSLASWLKLFVEETGKQNHSKSTMIVAEGGCESIAALLCIVWMVEYKNMSVFEAMIKLSYWGLDLHLTPTHLELLEYLNESDL